MDGLDVGVRIYVLILVHTYLYTSSYSYIHTYIRPHTRTYIRIYVLILVHTYFYTRTYTHTYMHAAHTYTRAYIHTYIQHVDDGAAELYRIHGDTHGALRCSLAHVQVVLSSYDRIVRISVYVIHDYVCICIE